MHYYRVHADAPYGGVIFQAFCSGFDLPATLTVLGTAIQRWADEHGQYGVPLNVEIKLQK